jgi:putative ABC transport system permease protein
MSRWISAFAFALRTLRRQPVFVLIALLTLTLGIGASTAIFSVVKAVVLDPLPYEDSERIVVLWEVNPEGSLDRVSIPTYQDWRTEARSLEAVAAYRQVDFTFAGSGEPLSVSGVRATPDLFDVLKARPAIGRPFTAEEAVLGADRVVVVSHGFWERALGADPAIVGRTIQLDAQAFTVVGVMPAGFEFPTSAHVDAWAPLAFNLKDIHGSSRRARSLMVVGRMTPGANLAGAQQELNVLSSRIAAEYKDSNDRWGARLVGARDQLVGTSRPALVVLMGAVGFLLLIVCANISNLLLARLSSRRREIAVRAALGAGRWDIVRPIVAESLLLSVSGAALGTLVALFGLRLLTTLDGRLPRLEQVRLDGPVLIFTALTSVAVALAFGLLPALHASHGDLRERLTESAGTPTRFGRRTLSTLVTIEVALALVLLVGASLMTRSFTKLLQVDPGFESNHLVAAQVFLPTTKYRERQTLVRFFEDVVADLRGAAGVRAASAVSILPMQEVTVASALPFNVEGQPPPRSEDPLADVRIVAPGYFETMKIPLIEGRLLDERDGEETPRTSVINETMARRYFPGRSPIGQVIQNPHGKSAVVGVVSDVRSEGLAAEPKKQVYLPMRQSPTAGMTLVARTVGDPEGLAGTIRRAVWSVDAEQPIYNLSTLDQLLARAVFLPRVSARLLASFALAALLLAALGIYGVLSYSVSQRTREMGLRMALGATAPRTVGLVVRGSLGRILLGVAFGLVAAAVLARSLAQVLYGVGPFDLASFSVAAALLVATGVAASLGPAWRATRVDPIVALRDS